MFQNPKNKPEADANIAEANREEYAIPRARTNLRYTVLACLLCAVGSYLISFWCGAKAPSKSDPEIFNAAKEIFSHLSTAFIVASVSIVGIEYNARRRAEKELAEFVEESKRNKGELISEFDRYRRLISENVFEAVLGRIVPEQLIQEIHEILRIPFVKTSTQYKLRFLPPYPDMHQDYCVVRRDLYFKVLNVSAELATFPIVSHYTSDENLEYAKWNDRPFHLQLTVNGFDVPEGTFRNGTKMEYRIELAPKGTATVYIQSEEPMRLGANRSFYYQSTPIDGLEVFIENDYKEAIDQIEVQMHHHGRGQATHDRHEAHYVLRRAFLPGQGFEAIWKRSSTLADGSAALLSGSE